MSAAPQKKQRDSKSRKVKRQPKTVEEFYIARGKDPINFRINENGDLVAAAVRDGDVEKIFQLPTYRELTVAEKIAVDSERRTKVAEAETAVQDAQTELRETLERFRAGEAYASDVVIANQAVSNAEKSLQAIAWAGRQIINIDSIDTRHILLDEQYEVRKIPYTVYQYKHYPSTWQDAYVSDKAAPEPAAAAEGETEGAPTEKAPMTAAERGRLGGILKIRRAKKF